jgi:hypothetical protein
LGTKSYATHADINAADTNGVVSIGQSGTNGFTRRIINVSDGINATDAATVGQIKTITGLDATKGNVVQYDGADKSSVTFAGTKGTALNNVNDITMNTTDAFNKNTTYNLSFKAAGLVPGQSQSSDSTAIGNIAFGDPNIGKNSMMSVSVGDLSTIGNDAERSVIVGYGNSISDGAQKSTVIGTNSYVSKQESIAIGQDTKVDTQNAIAIGNQANIQSGAVNSVAIGGLYEYSAEGGLGGGGNYLVEENAMNSTVVGAATLSQSVGGTALGEGARVTQNADNSVALGTKSYANRADINAADTNGVVSIGQSGTNGFTRRIINVSDGINPSDAATVAQLNTALKGFTNTGDVTKGQAVQYEKNGSLNAGTDGTGNLDLKKDGSASLSSNSGVAIVKAGTDSTSMSYGNNNVTVDQNGTTVNGSLKVNGDFSVNGSKLATQDTVNDMNKNLGTMKFDNTKASTMTDAVNQNYASITQNSNNIQSTKEHIGLEGNGRFAKIANGAATLTEGINTNTASIQDNSRSINSLTQDVSNLNDEVDSVGAVSAALAGLHPLDYSARSKFQVSAAVGTYDGTQAAAIGGFYHANKDVLFSLGASHSFGSSKKTAANIGITLRVGPSSPSQVSEEGASTNERINTLEKEIRTLKTELAAVKARTK